MQGVRTHSGLTPLVRQLDDLSMLEFVERDQLVMFGPTKSDRLVHVGLLAKDNPLFHEARQSVDMALCGVAGYFHVMEAEPTCFQCISELMQLMQRLEEFSW